MTACGRQHEYRIGRALVGATGLGVVGVACFPVGILRLFGRWIGVEETRQPARIDPWIRLIPTDRGSLADHVEKVPVRIILRPDSRPEPNRTRQDERRAWTFDPTTRFRTVRGLDEPLVPAIPDSILLHSEFLQALRLGNMGAALAMLDTTQIGEARRQFAVFDRWVNQSLGPGWEAEGKARRQTELWWRVVGEAEADGDH